MSHQPPPHVARDDYSCGRPLDTEQLAAVSCSRPSPLLGVQVDPSNRLNIRRRVKCVSGAVARNGSLGFVMRVRAAAA